MNDIAIQVENLAKQYRLGVVGTGTLTHDLNRWWHRVRGKEDPYLKIGETNDRTTKGESEYVWALKDINFEVQKGEVLGIIGKNGAGKSTLLKLLSRVTAPTTGEVRLKGRVASLLEVGTGFHPELTGRENIFLNAAILGMTKAETRSKLDEIVEFSGTARYIDTPVKRYSSGMRVRLAFAVAAFLEPEILIVDEVLAVGDAEFQKKAIGKMQDVSKGGERTVLFVSHNMAAVKSLCSRAMVLVDGTYRYDGEVADVISYYQNTSSALKKNQAWQLENAPGNDNVRILGISANSNTSVIDVESGVVLKLCIFSFIEKQNIDCTFELVNQDEIIVFHVGTQITCNYDSKVGEYEISCLVPPNLLNAGIYRVNIIIGQNQRFSLLKKPDILSFEVENVSRGMAMHKKPGVIRPLLEWHVNMK